MSQIFTFFISANCVSVNAWSPEFSYQNLQGGFFNWSALKMTKCQITCKSLQKSSKCQNFLRVWHIVIFRADQLKKPPCTINFSIESFLVQIKSLELKWHKPIASFKPLKLVTNQAEKSWSKNTLESFTSLWFWFAKLLNTEPPQQSRANHPQRDRHLPPWLGFSCCDF